ncbi:MAG: hypothetical protein AAFQ89_22585 [Cyanobacteria bacterium J06626_18]
MLSHYYAVLDTTRGSGWKSLRPRPSQTWSEVAAFIAVERCGRRKVKGFHNSWVILTDVVAAADVAHLICKHRGIIENYRHWVKDVDVARVGRFQDDIPALLFFL